MKKILVPCDFSKPSIGAFHSALDIAAQIKGSSVYLLNVIELPVLHDTVLMPVLNFEQELLNELKAKAEATMNKIIQKSKVGEVKVIADVKFGATFAMLLRYIPEHDIDLVVMGSHGASGAREIFIGSNAEKIVRKSPVPVLVVKDYEKLKIKSIVFPNTLDTEHQEDLTMKVKALQNFFEAQLHIVWINTPLNFTPDTVTLKRLEAFAKRFMLENYQLHVFNHTDEEEGILAFTNLINADLIAMATHGRRGIGHLLNGSLAEDVVNHSRNMVWTYSLKHDLIEA